jgi:F-type H+-transporting ATPase subunit b
MELILRELGRLFVRSIPTVIFVFLLMVILDRIFFRPLIKILGKRDEATRGALARAREQAIAAENKTLQYEQAFQAARQDVYDLREAARREVLAERERLVEEARQKSESQLKQALAALDEEIARVRQGLGGAAEPLAGQITEAVLSSESSPDLPPGASA